MMQLNWFSPLPPEQTDIAHYTARIASALMQRFDVVFWTDLKADASAMPRGARIRTFDPNNLNGREVLGNLLSRTNVYHFGNDARFHAGIYRLARRIPGIAVLHDTRLHHFIFELYRESGWVSYLDLARKLYGEEGLTKARSVVSHEGRTIDEVVAEMPFLEAITDRAAAIICHSEDAQRDVISRASVPVHTLPLPFTSLSGVEGCTRSWDAPWRFVMFGYVNPNRRLESVLRALGRLKDEVPFAFDVYGTLWDRPLVDKLIRDQGLSERVKVHGFVSERQLDEAIGQAHLAFNLRHPTMGEASGGILRSWSLGTPALVTDAGWYASLPDDVAPRIPADNDVEGIISTIRQLAGDPERFRQIGEAARAYAKAQHGPERYADLLAQTLSGTHQAMTRVAARALLERVSVMTTSRSDRSTLLSRAALIATDLLSSK